MTDLIAVGEALVVGIVPPDGPLVDLRLNVGGAEFNVAVALAHAQHSVQFATRVGRDPFGRLIVEALQDANVDALFDWEQTARTGFYVREQLVSGRSVTYYRAGSAGSRLLPASRLRAPVAAARRLHITGVTAALRPGNVTAVHRLMRQARRSATVVSFDVNFRSALWDVERAAPALQRLASEADLVLVGADEALELWGTRDAAEVQELLRVPELVYKDGDDRRVEVIRGNERHRFAVAEVPIVDSVGAGDAFAAGYLHAALSAHPDADLADQVGIAHAFAAEVMSTSRDALTAAGVRTALSTHVPARLWDYRA